MADVFDRAAGFAAQEQLRADAGFGRRECQAIPAVSAVFCVEGGRVPVFRLVEQTPSNHTLAMKIALRIEAPTGKPQRRNPR